MPNGSLDIKTLESWLWEAACRIRGDVDAPKYKDYILPIIFIKRLSDVFDDEIQKLAEKYKKKEIAEQLVEQDHNLVRFYLPENSRWGNISKQTTKLGEFMTDAARSIARENPKLQGVVDIVDFNATTAGQRVISDEKLKDLGINFSTANANDKPILVCFFDYEQSPSRKFMWQLSKKVQELKAKDVVIFAVQASKIEKNTLDKLIEKYNFSFPVGMIQADENETRFNWGVKSLPRLILTDKKHIVHAEGFSLGELDETNLYSP